MARRVWLDEEDGEDGGVGDYINMEGAEEVPQYLEQTQSRVVRTSSREELIESIKRGETATWVPNEALQAFLAKENVPTRRRQRVDLQDPPPSVYMNKERSHEVDSNRQDEQTPKLDLPAELERPRSALHSGDFWEASTKSTPRTSTHPFVQGDTSIGVQGRPFPLPWDATPRIASLPRFHSDLNKPDNSVKDSLGRARAPSLGSSLSSGFVMRTPTSPLVYSASNAESEIDTHDVPMQLSASPDKNSRRRTLPPESFRSTQTSPGSTQTPNFSRPLPTSSGESSLPQQTHQPRRSLTSFTYQPFSTPQTPTSVRPRRPSMSSDISPSHASMVGSFEESILRGRMSTAPSKPLDFVAQIGVLGKGNCKPSLRCPAHVTVSFPAVFYNYPSTGTSRSFADDSPSPYVGNIDLEHSLRPVELRKHNRRHDSPSKMYDKTQLDITAPENTPIGRALAREQRQRHRRSQSPTVSLGGCYRVPEQGQLQIVIKNPNKTAVKLYLVPYELEGMEAGTKTFVRQRSFSAGPILEKPLSDKLDPSPMADPLKDKHVLRYLIHLKFCCPARGRYYLYDNVRVVFANRVPDGKEKLRNEIQLPEPRFSPYRPGRDLSAGTVGVRAGTAAAFRRRSSGFKMNSPNIDAMDGIVFNNQPGAIAQPRLPAAVTAIPFIFTAGPKKRLAQSEPGHARFQTEAMPVPVECHETPGPPLVDENMPKDRVVSPVPGFLPSTSARGSPVSWSPDSGSSSVGSFSPAPVENGEGLLARKLRDLGAQNGTG